MARQTQKLRDDAVAAFCHAVSAVRPEALVPAVVSGAPGHPAVAGRPLPQVGGRRLVVALGKAAGGLAQAWCDLCPAWPTSVTVFAPHGVPVPPAVAARATVLRGAHPYPDAAGERSARQLLAQAGDLGPDDLMLVLLSGGTSALLAAPVAGVGLHEVILTTRVLLAAGAPIPAVNTVRRQLLTAAGGGLARAAHPARVATLVLSDVLGDPLESIGSGPTVPSPTTATDALEVLERYSLLHSVPRRVAEVLRESVGSAAAPDAGWWAGAITAILANNQTAVHAAAEHLRAQEYQVVTLAAPIVGEASVRGRELARLAQALEPGPPTAVVAGGETTVTVRGRGRGGRNQELALAAALELDGCARPIVLLAAGTDGVDGISDAAGGLAEGSTAARIRGAGLDPEHALAANDSATALAAAGASVVTGPTGTNVCDLVIITMNP